MQHQLSFKMKRYNPLNGKNSCFPCQHTTDSLGQMCSF